MDISFLSEDTAVNTHCYVEEEEKKDNASKNKVDLWKRSQSPDYSPDFSQLMKGSKSDTQQITQDMNAQPTILLGAGIEIAKPLNPEAQFLMDKHLSHYKEHQSRKLERDRQPRSRSPRSPIFGRTTTRNHQDFTANRQQKEGTKSTNKERMTNKQHPNEDQTEDNGNPRTSAPRSIYIPPPKQGTSSEDKLEKIEKAKCNAWATFSRYTNFLEKSLKTNENRNDAEDEAIERAQMALIRCKAIKFRCFEDGNMQDKTIEMLNNEDPEMRALQAAQRRLERLKGKVKSSERCMPKTKMSEEESLDIYKHKDSRNYSNNFSGEHIDQRRQCRELKLLQDTTNMPSYFENVTDSKNRKGKKRIPHTVGTSSNRSHLFEDNSQEDFEDELKLGKKRKTTSKLYVKEDRLKDHRMDKVLPSAKYIKRRKLDERGLYEEGSSETEVTGEKKTSQDEYDNYTDSAEENNGPPFTQRELYAIEAAKTDLNRYKKQMTCSTSTSKNLMQIIEVDDSSNNSYEHIRRPQTETFQTNIKDYFAQIPRRTTTSKYDEQFNKKKTNVGKYSTNNTRSTMKEKLVKKVRWH